MNPRKRNEILGLLLKRLNAEVPPDENLEEMEIEPVPQPPTADDIVVEYYHRDDISRISPGRKDVAIVCIDGVKHHLQKRHMLMSLKEAFQLFKSDIAKEICRISKFCALRPPDVFLSSDLPHDTCCCRLHEDFLSLLKAVAPLFGIPGYSSRWVEEHVIDPSHPECQVSIACESCAEGNYLIHSFPQLRPLLLDEDLEVDDPLQVVQYKVWCKGLNGRWTRSEEVTLKSKAVRDFLSSLPDFVLHHNIKVLQHSAYLAAKGSATPTGPLLQFDFAENYECIIQSEIQAAHWGHAQVTLFTCCIWTAQANPVNFVVVSDDLRHHKETAIAYLLAILEELFSAEQKVSNRHKND